AELYKVTNLSTLPECLHNVRAQSARAESWALDLNDRGDVVGVLVCPFYEIVTKTDPHTGHHSRPVRTIAVKNVGFIYHAGTLEQLPDGSGATGVNESGDVIGDFDDGLLNPGSRGFLYVGGVLQEIDQLVPVDINDAGQLAADLIAEVYPLPCMGGFCQF